MSNVTVDSDVVAVTVDDSRPTPPTFWAPKNFKAEALGIVAEGQDVSSELQAQEACQDEGSQRVQLNHLCFIVLVPGVKLRQGRERCVMLVTMRRYRKKQIS